MFLSVLLPEDITIAPLPNKSYTVLQADDSLSDVSIVEMLPLEIAGTVISQSSQWVLLDDFGELQRIPLMEYENRIESFDPRNDGYADKLHSFFIQNGKRFLFIPRLPETQALVDKALETFDESIASVTIPQFSPENSTPFTVKHKIIYLALGTAAFLVILVFSQNRLFWLCAYPVFAALSITGASGLLLYTLLYTMLTMVLPVIKAYFTSRRYRRRVSGSIKKQIIIFYIVGFVFYLLVCIISTFWLGVTSFVCLHIILCMVLWVESNRGRVHNHIRFTPVPITGFSIVRPIKVRFVFPFIASVIFAYFVPVLLPDPVLLIDKFDWITGDTLIDSSDYEAHAFFQSTFSLFPLGAGIEERGEMQYRTYILEEGVVSVSADTNIMYKAPPFPLEALMNFLKDYNSIQVFPAPSHTLNFLWIVILLIFLLFCCIPIKSQITKMPESLAPVPNASIFLNTQVPFFAGRASPAPLNSRAVSGRAYDSSAGQPAPENSRVVSG